MASFPPRVVLGRSGLSVCPLGVSGGYRVGAKALLKAFDRGVNYWYHGSMRNTGMTTAIHDLVAADHRDDLAIVLQCYTRFPWHLERSLMRGLKQVRIECADVLLLGWYNKPPSDGLLERAMRLREKGLFRHLAISSHRRPSFVGYAADPRYSILHIRYNAAHVGAERDVFPHIGETNRPGIVAYTATRWGSLLNPKNMPKGEAPLRARDCYRFVLTNPDFNVSMTGPKNDEQMEEALSALDAGPLSPEENERIRRIGQHVHEHVGVLRSLMS